MLTLLHAPMDITSKCVSANEQLKLTLHIYEYHIMTSRLKLISTASYRYERNIALERMISFIS